MDVFVVSINTVVVVHVAVGGFVIDVAILNVVFILAIDAFCSVFNSLVVAVDVEFGCLEVRIFVPEVVVMVEAVKILGNYGLNDILIFSYVSWQFVDLLMSRHLV